MNNLSPKEILTKRYEEAQERKDWKMCGFYEWIMTDYGDGDWSNTSGSLKELKN